MGHMAGPTIYDLAGWAVVMLLVLRILRTGDQRLWLLVGLAVGVSLYAKHTILFLVIALLFGFVVGPPLEGAGQPLSLGGRGDRPRCCGCPTSSGRRTTAGRRLR